MTGPSHRRRALAVSTAAIVLVAIASCTGGVTPTPTPTPKSPVSSPMPAPTHTAKSKPKPKPKPAARAVNPLTGGKPSEHGVVAVKIDDTGNGQPQVNINKADIVYIEQVEGGLTRLLAVYDSILPTVEAVRSARASDPELMAQYGRVAYVASGGAHNPLHVLDKSRLRTDINDRGGPGFQRDNGRYAPYNLRANLKTIAKALHPPKARDVGFRWSRSSAELKGKPTGWHVRTVVGSTPVAFDYNHKTARYERYIGGVLQRSGGGKVISTPNVIVQFCSVTTYLKDIDVNGNPSKWTHTMGKGKVTVFTRGRRINGTWSRHKRAGGTTFSNSHGKPITLLPGGAWVVLVADGSALTAAPAPRTG